ncbi:MAG: hypothetical protein ACXACC_10225 [Promethearchaeota archaeon]|jgi:hypothetical protein
MLFVELFASDLSQVGVAWFDFYSIGHLCFGVGVFLFFSLFYTVPKNKGHTPIFSLLFVFICTMVIIILWEVFENTLFIEIGWKFEGRADSWQNITTDILVGALGALGSWLFCYIIFIKEKNIWAYYIFGIIGFALWLVVFIILRIYTLT